MRKIILSVSSAALMMLAAGAAQAADLPPPPAPAPSAFSFTVFGGASWLNDVDTNYDGFFNEDAEVSFDTGYLVGGSAGFTLVDWARTELEVAYAGYDLDSIELDGFEYDDLDGSLGVLTVMGNVWFGFNSLPLVGGTVDQAAPGWASRPTSAAVSVSASSI
jgi:opacity protein-like surface antigen